MTSWAKIKVNGKSVIAKLGGYTGKTEKASPTWDIMTANRAWITEKDAKRLKLKPGKVVVVTVARKRVKGKVYRWSRGSMQIIFNQQLNLTRKQASRIRVDIR